MPEYQFPPVPQGLGSCVLELDSALNVLSGGTDKLNDALSRAANLKIETWFRHDEHMDMSSPIKDMVCEVSEFPATLVVDSRWSAAFMTLRQPADVPLGFGPRPSLSLFMYNCDGTQAIARPYLDGGAVTGEKGSCPPPAQYKAHTKMRYIDCYDEGTNAPSYNFVYAFERFRYIVRDHYHLVCRISPEGDVMQGSVRDLLNAQRAGRILKVGIDGVCTGLNGDQGYNHTLFIQIGFGYYYMESNLFVAETHPFPRIAPDIPLRYKTNNWDYCWAIPRTDGQAALMCLDPYTLRFTRHEQRYGLSYWAQ